MRTIVKSLIFISLFLILAFSVSAVVPSTEIRHPGYNGSEKTRNPSQLFETEYFAECTCDCIFDGPAIAFPGSDLLQNQNSIYFKGGWKL